MLCSLISLMHLLGSIVHKITLIMLSILISDISNNAEMTPVTRQNLHSYSLYLWLMFTLHTHYCIIFDSLYMHNIALLSLCFASCSLVASGNNILNISVDIKLPSLPISTLHLIFALFVFYCFPNFLLY